jgi:formamidopyrimidine-DNA glycosylase
VAGLTGARIVGANRRGKWLLFPLDNDGEMAVHLRMSGRLLVAAPSVPRPLHTHAALVLAGDADDPMELRFVDPRTFGEVVVYDAAVRDAVLPEVARLGPDPLLDGVDPDRLGTLLAGTSRAAKAVLLDQSVIAGVGTIYADEILHRCRISPTRPARAVSSSEVALLARVTVEVRGRRDAPLARLSAGQAVRVSASGDLTVMLPAWKEEILADGFAELATGRVTGGLGGAVSAMVWAPCPGSTKDRLYVVAVVMSYMPSTRSISCDGTS